MFIHKHFLGVKDTGEVDDIIRNLNHVLKTKRGCGYFLPTFGLSDVGFRTLEEMVTILTEEIQENIRFYEPRVEVTSVDEIYDNDGRKVRLAVRLRLRSAQEKLKIVVDLEKRSFDIVPLAEGERR